MKNKLIFAGMLALVLVFGLITIGCPTNGGTEEENNVTKFEGTWLNGSDRKFSFSAYQWEYSETSQNLLNSGNFTFTDTAITFTPQLGSTWTQNYTLENNSLNLEQPQPQNGGYA